MLKSVRKSRKIPRKSLRKTSRKSNIKTRNTRKSRKKSIKKTRKKSVKKSIKKSVNKKSVIILQKSKVATKKLAAIIGNKTVNFGAKGYSDFTIHKDIDRMHRYEGRHKSRENWGKSGIETAGFWSKWILWNKPSLTGSIKDTEKRFNIKIINKI